MTSKHQDKIDKIFDTVKQLSKHVKNEKEWGFNIALDVNLDKLMYYMTWCDGKRFKEDIFSEERFTDEYVTGKFHDFQDRFPSFLNSLSDKYKTLFCVAVYEFSNPTSVGPK